MGLHKPFNPLARPTAKLQRAEQHIAEFEEAIKAFRKGNPYVTPVQPQNDAVTLALVQPLPTALGLIAGDAVHALRSALDHLTYGLVRRGGRRDPNQSPFPRFPIHGDRKNFNGSAPKIPWRER